MDWFKSIRGKTSVKGDDGLKERRHSYRVRSRMEGLLVIPPSAALPCYVIDFSNTGMRVLLDVAVKKEAIVKVILQGRPGQDTPAEELDLKARVVWCQKLKLDVEFSLGLAFTEPNPHTLRSIVDFMRRLKGIEVQTDMKQKRQTRRLVRRFPLKHRVAGGNYYDGFTRDLSNKGVRFACDRPLPIDEEIEVWIDIQDEQEPILLVGDVVRCETIPDEKFYDITMQTVHLVEEDRKRLDLLLQRATSRLL